jgi:predicted nucleic-acid-binding Zn-ribbon protein
MNEDMRRGIMGIALIYIVMCSFALLPAIRWRNHHAAWALDASIILVAGYALAVALWREANDLLAMKCERCGHSPMMSKGHRVVRANLHLALTKKLIVAVYSCPKCGNTEVGLPDMTKDIREG